MKIPPQILRDSKQKKGTPSEKERPSSGQNRNPSVVFLWSNGKIAAVKTAAISILVDPRRIELPNLSDANRTLSQLSYGPILTIFQSKKLRKTDFEIFNFEGKVRKIGQEIGRGKRAGDGSPYGCEPYALPAELRPHVLFTFLWSLYSG